jgi:Dolichyl-phosphate-mannose-protein mannosyltransferase
LARRRTETTNLLTGFDRANCTVVEESVAPGRVWIIPRRVLLVVVLLFVVAAGLVSFWTGPWEATDEPDHVRNTVTLVRGRLYRIGPRGGIESFQPPLYYIGLAGWHKALFLEPARPSPEFELSAEGPIVKERYPGSEADASRVHRLRLPSIACGVIVVLLTWAAARRLSTDPWTPVVAAAIVAGVPKLVFVSAVVNNDNLLNALGALLVFLVVRWVTQPPSSTARRIGAAAVLGMVLGALILTKLTALPMVVGVVVALVCIGERLGERLLLVLASAASAALVSGWWLIRNVVTYGDPLALSETKAFLREHVPINIVGGDPFLERVLVTIPRGLFERTFYVSGWNQPPFTWPGWAHLLFWLLALGALAGLFRSRRATPSPASRSRVLLVLALFLLGALASVWAVGLQITDVQGRHAFGGLAAFGCLAAVGLERLRLPVAARFTLPVAGLVGTAVAIHQDVWNVYVR